MSFRSLALASACLTVLSCQSPPPKSTLVEAADSGVADDPHFKRAAYEAARSSKDLRELLRIDLAAGRAATALRGLEAFVLAQSADDNETFAHAVAANTQPELLFQQFGGRQQLSAVRELVQVAAGRLADLEATYQAYARRDLAGVRAAFTRARGPLHPDTIAENESLAAHADLLRAALDYEEWIEAAAQTPQDASQLVARLDRAGQALAQAGEEAPAFLAIVLAAQTLEAAGERDLAVEQWILATKSAFWRSANANVRAGVLGRIQSYRSRLREEVNAELEDEHASAMEEQRSEFEARHVRDLKEIDRLSKELTGVQRDLEETQDLNRVVEELRQISLEAQRLDTEQASAARSPIGGAFDDFGPNVLASLTAQWLTKGRR